jgi:hypothetical protein
MHPQHAAPARREDVFHRLAAQEGEADLCRLVQADPQQGLLERVEGLARYAESHRVGEADQPRN